MTLLDTAQKMHSPRAMSNIALMLIENNRKMQDQVAAGAVLEIDEEEIPTSLTLLKRAADLGFTKAITNLGICYLKGIGVDLDEQEAKKCFEEASNKKDPLAIYFVSYLKLRDAFLKDPTNQNYQLKEYQDAADCLHYVLIDDPYNDQCHYYLGYLYENGLGVDLDYTTAIKHYRKAVELSKDKNALACFKYGSMLYSGNGNGNFIQKDKALEYFVKAAELNDKNALNVMGVLYEKGEESITKNPEKALKYYTQAACLGSKEAKFNLGSLLLNNPETEPFIKSEGEEAIKYIIEAAKKGHETAIDILQKKLGRKPNLYSTSELKKDTERLFTINDVNKARGYLDSNKDNNIRFSKDNRGNHDEGMNFVAGYTDYNIKSKGLHNQI